MDTRKMEKLNELFADAAFAEQVRTLDTAGELQALLAEKGIELTQEEFEELLEACEKLAGQADGELTDEQMEDVSGGVCAGTILLCAVAVACISWHIKRWFKANARKKTR
ncbi:MAG: hypothetical protein ACI4WX_01870 [Aristaeellaceae bacterium]